MQQGSGYLSSNGIITSRRNEEILPKPPENSKQPYSFYKLRLFNLSPITLQINNREIVFIDAYQNFEINENDMPIWSLKITDSDDCKFNWVGYY